MRRLVNHSENETAKPGRGFWMQGWLPGVLLMAAVLLAYQPAWRAGFIWDDDHHVTGPELRSTGGLARIWMRPGATQQYYPLVHSVFWLEQRLWGYSPPGYHLVNILLHAGAAWLLAKILWRLEVRGAWLAAALFALHPIQVESVAWISELKNTLSGVFYLGAALAYLGFDRHRQGRYYALAFGLFILGLLSKTVIATLPAALLVVFWWQRGQLRWRRDILPLTPFFVAGIGAGLVTMCVERTFIGAQGAEFDFSVIERFLIAGRAIWFYLGRLCWPIDLIFIYPRWEICPTAAWQYLYPAAVVLLLGGLYGCRRRWRGPLAAMLFFVGTLFPALGFVNVYPFRFSFVADHFQYLASIGPLILIAAGIDLLFKRFQGRSRFGKPVLGGLLLAVLCVLTWRQARIYQSSETLWRATLGKNPECWVACDNLSSLFFKRGQADEAMLYSRKALEIRPRDEVAYTMIGDIHAQAGRLDAAVANYQEALAIMPGYVIARFNLAHVLCQTGSGEDAIAQYQKILEIQPDCAPAYHRLGNVYRQAGRRREAVAQYQQALKWQPDYADAHNDLGNVLFEAGEVTEAIPHYRRALELQPAHADAHSNLGVMLFSEGHVDAAISHWRTALQINPQYTPALKNLAWVLATSPNDSIRNGAEAITLARKANHLCGGKDLIVLQTLAAAYAEGGQFSEAIITGEQALSWASNQANPSLAAALRMQLALYRTGRPFHETGQGSVSTSPENP
jgi:protein O-mannosyl-transferase